jgi:hypothetical protein
VLEASTESATRSRAAGMRKTPGRGQGHALLVIADFNSIHTPPALFGFRSMRRDRPVTVEPFQFSSRWLTNGVKRIENTSLRRVE